MASDDVHPAGCGDVGMWGKRARDGNYQAKTPTDNWMETSQKQIVYVPTTSPLIQRFQNEFLLGR